MALLSPIVGCDLYEVGVVVTDLSYVDKHANQVCTVIINLLEKTFKSSKPGKSSTWVT